MLPLDDVLPELAWPVSAPHCDIVRNVNTNYKYQSLLKLHTYILHLYLLVYLTISFSRSWFWSIPVSPRCKRNVSHEPCLGIVMGHHIV